MGDKFLKSDKGQSPFVSVQHNFNFFEVYFRAGKNIVDTKRQNYEFRVRSEPLDLFKTKVKVSSSAALDGDYKRLKAELILEM
jgi:hypothetical protein